MISEQTYRYVENLDKSIARKVVDAINTELETIYLVGYAPSDSFSRGFADGLKISRKLLLCDSKEKAKIYKEITSKNLYCHWHYSCKSYYNEGFKRGIKYFNKQLEKTKLT